MRTPRFNLSISITILAMTVLFFPITSLSAPVPDTGQTKCYGSGSQIVCPSQGQAYYGQDTQYSTNKRSYTKLDADGNDLPDSSAEWFMVRDNNSGLIWEGKNSLDGVANYANPHDADNNYTWYDSNPITNGGYAGIPGTNTDTEDFINALNSDHFGGFSDWRLPTVKELSLLVNRGTVSPSIDIAYFPILILIIGLPPPQISVPLGG